MSVWFSDDFNRADEEPPSGWVYNTSTSKARALISGNKLLLRGEAIGSGVGGYLSKNVLPTTANVELYHTCVSSYATGPSPIGIRYAWVRTNTYSAQRPTNGYLLYYDAALYVYTRYMFKAVNGSFTSLGSYTQSAYIGRYSMRANGTTISYTFNGDVMLSVTDSSIQSAGYAGFQSGAEDTTGDIVEWYFDDVAYVTYGTPDPFAYKKPFFFNRFVLGRP